MTDDFKFAPLPVTNKNGQDISLVHPSTHGGVLYLSFGRKKEISDYPAWDFNLPFNLPLKIREICGEQSAAQIIHSEGVLSERLPDNRHRLLYQDEVDFIIDDAVLLNAITEMGF